MHRAQPSNACRILTLPEGSCPDLMAGIERIPMAAAT
jgi:hypothetical protein